MPNGLGGLVVFGSIVVYLKKVSLYMDEKLWVGFKEAILKKHGTLRKLSTEVESLVGGELIEEDVEVASGGMGVDVKTIASPEEVKRNRPKLRGPTSETLVREMRDRRSEAVP